MTQHGAVAAERTQHGVARSLMLFAAAVAVGLAGNPAWGGSPAEEASEILKDLSPDERLYVRKLATGLVTRANSKANPGDVNTWYVLTFVDTAKGMNRTGHVTMVPGTRTMLMSTSHQSQNKVTRHVEVVQGKLNAAKRIMEYQRSGNGAANQLRAPGSAGRSGNLNRQAFQVTGTRKFDVKWFQSRSDAEAYKASLVRR